jgi:Family of unknown function (DUF6445)
MIEFNDDAVVQVKNIGQRGIIVTRIENVLTNPAEVAALGVAQSFTTDPGNFYPGMRAPVPEAFSMAFRPWLGRLLQREFQGDTSYFSVVTTARADLLPIQRIPHYDSTHPGLYAAVIYLCDSRFSGTSFYRHRRTGYEEITEDNRMNYQLALDNELRLLGPPEREYVNGDSALFETIFSNELMFNSAIIYPGRVLHAANIGRGFEPPKTSADWRLTITSLLHAA